MKIWVITSRAFSEGEYFERLEETKVAKTEEEAKKVFSEECSKQEDWFWCGMDENPYDHYELGDGTYVLVSDECMCVVTKRETEI